MSSKTPSRLHNPLGLTAAALLALAGATAAHALPSNLDTNFGYDASFEGYTILSYVNTGIWLTQVKGLVVDGDGGIVMVGEGAPGSTADKDILVTRYHNDGTPDTTFGSGGFALFDVAAGDDAGYQILHTAGGKYLVAGTSTGGGVVLLRVNADGSLDTTFGTNGFTTWNGNGSNPPLSITVLSDGGIVLAKNGFLVWFDADGAYVKEDYDANRTAYNIRAHGSGAGERIHAVGSGVQQAYPGGPNTLDANMVIFAYNTDGTPDTAFGTDGMAASGVLNTNSNARFIFTDLALDSQGRIVGIGYENFEVTGNTKQYNMYVARFTADGQLDTTFNAADATYGGGIVKINGPSVNGYSKDMAHALVIQADDKILIAGESGQNSSAVARLNADGTPDTGFATDGLATSLPYGTAAAYAIGLQADGRISVAGGDKENGPKNPVVFQLWGDADPNADTAAPTIIGYYPAQDEILDPDTQQWVGAIFDEEMDEATLEGGIAVSCNGGSALSGTYNYNYTPGGINHTVYFNLAGKLPYDANCTVTLSGNAADIAGNALGGDAQWSFTTGTAPAADTTPDAFAFTALSNVAFATEQTSAPVTITGMDSAADISVTGGSYSIGCDGSFTTAAGTIDNGQTVCVRHTSAGTCLGSVTTQLNVGGITAEFTTTTEEPQTDDDGDGVTNCQDSQPGDNTIASPRTGAGDTLVVTTGGGALMQVTQHDDPTTAGTVPDNVTLPYGALSYSVTGLNPGDTVSVTIDYPSLSSGHVVYKCCDSNGAFYAYDNATINGNRVTLTLTDGGAGDNDGTVNGSIEDPMAIAAVSTTGGGSGGGSGGGGGGALGPLALLALFPIGRRLLAR